MNSDQFAPLEHSSQEPGFVSKLNGSLTKGRSQIPRQRSIKRKQESGEYIKTMRKVPTTMKRTYFYDQPISATRRIWSNFALCVTCCIPLCCLRKCGLPTKGQQIAWREKISLVFVIILLALLVGFLTFGFQQTVCGVAPLRVSFDTLNGAEVVIRGKGYDFSQYNHPGGSSKLPRGGIDMRELSGLSSSQRDLTFMFQDPSSCSVLFGTDAVTTPIFPCTIGGADVNKATKISDVKEACHDSGAFGEVLSWRKTVNVFMPWDQVQDSSNYFIYNNFVLDASKFDLLNISNTKIDLSNLNGFNFIDFKSSFIGKDATFYLNKDDNSRQIGKCFESMLTIAQIDTDTAGCIITNIVLYVSLVFIIGVVLIRFILAIFYAWFLSARIGKPLSESEKEYFMNKKFQEEEYWQKFQKRGQQSQSLMFGAYSQYKHRMSSFDLKNSPSQTSLDKRNSVMSDASSEFPQAWPHPEMFYQEEVMHTILLVTAYSEDEEGLRNTLESLACTDYSDTHKLILVICDGIIKGSGNERSTPEIAVGMMDLDPAFPNDPVAYSYVSIAEGSKRHNMAKIFAGYYNSANHRVPMITVVKTGTPEEATNSKPGNRGKRDSQIVLMNFLQKVTFDDRMTPLEYDLFQKIQYLCRNNPDKFEACVMVDADTRVEASSLKILVSAFTRDDAIIGLCGETRISNKWSSWVSMIQVFEYYLAHHNAKAFESVFGGVTCLPGCFCAYRIKAPKGDGFFVPILGNPEIVEQYSENVVDTLHKKNLYLLGEDRFLTTIMLKTFPRRKMMFIPQALCKTEVPDKFRVLLSQRRRWINSTVHNLLELVLVSDLCGTFCISMQFVIFMELVGTVVLPAAIIFTFWLIISSIIWEPAVIPLILLAAILGLPALLIAMTSKRWNYVGWMLVYLLSLPIWNLVLPSYAFWHFDDFTYNILI
eukprot:NODE_230_length_12188_cov_0.969890.p1 type:complete len:933 gc:universal NODE_230_length_12188_cov_0.969890:10229-7431(-)